MATRFEYSGARSRGPKYLPGLIAMMIESISELSVTLCCAQCETPFHSEATHQVGSYSEFDVLSCPCSAHPVVAGIPVLQKGAIGAAHQSDAEVIEHIRQGRHSEALLAMLLPPPPPDSCLVQPWMHRLPRPLRHRVSSRYVRHRGLPQWQAEAKAFLTASERQESAGEFLDFYLHSVHRGQPAYDSNFNYMLYRFGMPRHLSAISLASIIRNPEGPILELGCGCGHTTRTWLERGRGQPVVGIDNCFWALFVAKNWIAPQASYICCEADRSLPFVEHSFAVISANDAFHCFRDKTGSMREFRRVKRPGGAFVLTGMANVAASTNIGTTYRLHPAGYQRLVRDLPHRLVSDAQVLERYLGKHGPALKHYIHPQRLLAERFLSLVVSEDESLFQDYEAFEDWPHAQGELRLNPLFVPASQMGDSVCLRRQFPSEKYAAEHVEFERYLPKEIELSTQLLADVAAGRRTKEMEHLLSRCVIVGMPERFLPPATDLVQRLAAQATERECRSTFASARALVAALLALCQSHLYSWSEVVGDLLSL